MILLTIVTSNHVTTPRTYPPHARLQGNSPLSHTQALSYFQTVVGIRACRWRQHAAHITHAVAFPCSLTRADVSSQENSQLTHMWLACGVGALSRNWSWRRVLGNCACARLIYLLPPLPMRPLGLQMPKMYSSQTCCNMGIYKKDESYRYQDESKEKVKH